MDFVARRRRLLAEVKTPVLLAAGAPLSRNYPANTWPFRADSNFLYFFDAPEPDSAAFLDDTEADGVRSVREAKMIKLHPIADAGWPQAGERIR